MTNIKPKIYAQVLVLALADKKTGIFERFFKVLERNGDTKKIKQIAAEVEKILLEKSGNKDVVIETARRVPKNSLKHFIKKGDIVREKINPELIAGVKIIVNGEKQLDFSLQKKLDEIFSPG